jgi:hypothetical protein
MRHEKDTGAGFERYAESLKVNFQILIGMCAEAHKGE